MTTETLSHSSTDMLNGVARLDHLGVIQVQGEDAAKFIHGQLTQDFALLGMDQARLAALCSAKGRMQASFVGFKRSTGDLLLICSKDLLAQTLKRLSMFVLRAKAKLSDVSDRFDLYGLIGNAIDSGAASADGLWAKVDLDEKSIVNLYPAEGRKRQLVVQPAGHVAPEGVEIPAALWRWTEVRSGIATLSTPVFEAFVPQMLNYESVGGVNFKKGCYPGQEVVARSQFRGTLKRRAFIVRADGALASGQEVFGADDDQPVGIVVQAEKAPDGAYDAIVSLQLTAVEVGKLRVGTVALRILPLPYPLLDDI